MRRCTIEIALGIKAYFMRYTVPLIIAILSSRQSRNVIKPRADLAVEGSDGELIVLDKVGREVHQLSQSAALVWHGLSEGLAIDEIAVTLTEAFDVEHKNAISDVRAAITQLRELGLLVD